jgi:hypothetical protein
MSALVEFLLARISDDAGIAESVSPPPWHVVDGDDEVYIISQDFGEQIAVTDHLNVDHIMQWDPARVLAECEAKRQIVDHAATVSSMDQQIESEWGTRGSVPWDEDEGIRLLRLLALPYADHPDYDQAWTFTT